MSFCSIPRQHGFFRFWLLFLLLPFRVVLFPRVDSTNSKLAVGSTQRLGNMRQANVRSTGTALPQDDFENAIMTCWPISERLRKPHHNRGGLIVSLMGWMVDR